MSEQRGGPGYRRMIARLGEDGYRRLCEDNLRLKEEALARAAGERQGPATDREQYSGYPRPRPRRRRAS